jgi:hypothetical protein
MEQCDSKPVKYFTDRSKGIHFKIVQTKEGFNLYESKDKNRWRLKDRNLSLLEVMTLQGKLVDSNLMNYINLLSIIKNKRRWKDS